MGGERWYWGVVVAEVSMIAHADISKITLEKRTNPCPFDFLLTAIT